MLLIARGFVLAAAIITIPTMLVAQAMGDMDMSPDEGPIAQVSARLAYNTEDEGVIGLGLRTDRLFGPNHVLSLDAEATQDATRLSFTYLNGSAAGAEQRFGLRAFRNDQRSGDVYQFDSVVTGLVPRLTWRLGQTGSLSAYAAFTRAEIDNLPPDGSDIIRRDLGTQTAAAVGTELSLRYPGTGGARQDTRFGFDIAYGSTSRDHDYLRYTARVAILHALSEGNVVLRSQLRVGAIETQSGTSSIGDRFMLGDASIRGFAFGGFGPRDRAVDGSPALGGNRFAVMRLDAQFPNAFGAASDRLVPGVFLDAGSLWSLDNVAGGPSGANPVDDGAHLRASVGVSLRIRTGIGPIDVYVANPFERQGYDRTQTVGLSLSRRF
jgi:outer membrane protein insertion porin family